MAETHPDDLAGVAAWFGSLAHHVQQVDFTGARAIFADDMIAFGTVSDFMVGQKEAERQQWRSVWFHIDNFHFRPDIRAIVSPDRLQAVGLGIFDSTGYHPDGVSYDRPGRASVVLTRETLVSPWKAAHTHLSLFRDVPTRSVKNKAEKLSGAI